MTSIGCHSDGYDPTVVAMKGHFWFPFCHGPNAQRSVRGTGDRAAQSGVIATAVIVL